MGAALEFVFLLQVAYKPSCTGPDSTWPLKWIWVEVGIIFTGLFSWESRKRTTLCSPFLSPRTSCFGTFAVHSLFCRTFLLFLPLVGKPHSCDIFAAGQVNGQDSWVAVLSHIQPLPNTAYSFLAFLGLYPRGDSKDSCEEVFYHFRFWLDSLKKWGTQRIALLFKYLPQDL